MYTQKYSLMKKDYKLNPMVNSSYTLKNPLTNVQPLKSPF